MKILEVHLCFPLSQDLFLELECFWLYPCCEPSLFNSASVYRSHKLSLKFLSVSSMRFGIIGLLIFYEF